MCNPNLKYGELCFTFLRWSIYIKCLDFRTGDLSFLPYLFIYICHHLFILGCNMDIYTLGYIPILVFYFLFFVQVVSALAIRKSFSQLLLSLPLTYPHHCVFFFFPSFLSLPLSLPSFLPSFLPPPSLPLTLPYFLALKDAPGS